MALYPDDANDPSETRAAIGVAVATRLARNPMVSRVRTDKAEMYLRPGFLSAAECAGLVALSDGKGHKSSALFSGTVNASYRTSTSVTLSSLDPLVETVTNRICTLLSQPAVNSESLQIQRYDVGQEYRSHCDYFPGGTHYWPKMRDGGGQRCWTAMIYLNDVDGGGETCFPHLDVMVTPKRGTLLIWNNLRADGSPNPDTRHAALPVSAGVKYVVTKWFRERPWVAAD